MKIGLTYDLQEDYLRRGYTREEAAEFDTEETIAAIELVLQDLGHEVERIGGFEELLLKLTSGKRPQLVFNLCEGSFGFSREAQVPAVLDAYCIPHTFSDAMVLAVTLHKALTKRIVRDLGVASPGFAVIENIGDINDLDMPFPLFAKPVAEGSSKGISASSIVYDLNSLKKVCTDLLIKYRQAVLVEEFLPGREFTAGILGTGEKARVIGAMEVVFKHDDAQETYSYASKFINNREWVEYRRVDKELFCLIEKKVMQVWRGLGCRDAGRMDFRMDKGGHLNFLEINPLAGLNPVHGDLPILCRLYGIPYQELIKAIMDSALERVNQ
ncbi:D-alanine--D-alanine ligase [Sporomusa silvacetica DSM 10669]|uniref:D-alanine--D-alanine ligase n=1 Tax=Sporomusa silvacetica DSM 10669 TaxID=1123289 RepID=A0ABZ3IP25_9FIRM|nr:hypothetical protein [Sporomusa silvacetica]OZC18059.1 D-alanine--D-alanine ligase [Sporomusa silvacetica DSM 10669]